MGHKEPEFFSSQIVNARRFFRALNIQGADDAVMSGGHEYCRDDYDIQRKLFPYITLEYISAGKGLWELNGREYVAEPGTVVFYGPEHPHRIRAIPGENMHKYFISVSPAASRRSSFRYGTVFYVQESLPILRRFEEIIDYGLNPSPKANDICLTIFDLLIQECELNAVDYGQVSEERYFSYTRCKALITENYQSLRSQKEAAELCAVSQGYLCKLFERYDHQSPYSYLIALRMNYAAQMVMDRHIPIQEIARRMGYEDQGHFTRVFKRVFGSPPQKMRSVQAR